MRKAFTLVELLIVIAIIAILAAIAIPQFSKYKERAYVAAMMSDAHNLIAAEEAFYADQDQKYFVTNNTSNSPNYVQASYNETTGEIKYNNEVLLQLSSGVTLDNLEPSDCSGVPGYKFTLKHSRTSKQVTYDSCSSKAPEVE